MLTTERQQFEEWLKFHSDEEECTNLLQRNSAGTNYLHPHADLAWIAWQASRELLANREAQPVALVDRRPAASGGICWQHGGKDLPHGTELFTATPAPAVPGKATPGNIEILASGYSNGTFQLDDDEANLATEIWNACRAAMLAAAQEGGNDHDAGR
ncbi:hypothetical protein RX587_003349 [Serratia marcescens]|nr:hypothetical protein [Serratia marcescens]